MDTQGFWFKPNYYSIVFLCVVQFKNFPRSKSMYKTMRGLDKYSSTPFPLGGYTEYCTYYEYTMALDQELNINVYTGQVIYQAPKLQCVLKVKDDLS